jgi:hypothetical protein
MVRARDVTGMGKARKYLLMIVVGMGRTKPDQAGSCTCGIYADILADFRPGVSHESRPKGVFACT